MRGFPLIPYLETPEEAARFFRRGWFRFYFPRYPIFSVFLWLAAPATDSIRHLSPSFNLHWSDLAWSMAAMTVMSFPAWLGCKRTYKDLLRELPAKEERI